MPSVKLNMPKRLQAKQPSSSPQTQACIVVGFRSDGNLGSSTLMDNDDNHDDDSSLFVDNNKDEDEAIDSMARFHRDSNHSPADQVGATQACLEGAANSSMRFHPPLAPQIKTVTGSKTPVVPIINTPLAHLLRLPTASILTFSLLAHRSSPASVARPALLDQERQKEEKAASGTCSRGPACRSNPQHRSRSPQA